MTNEEKNEWLTENVLKECWHTIGQPDPHGVRCLKCGNRRMNMPLNPDFYTHYPTQAWINFGLLWDAIKGKKWWKDFLRMEAGGLMLGDEWIHPNFISCSALADAIGDYFKWVKQV